MTLISFRMKCDSFFRLCGMPGGDARHPYWREEEDRFGTMWNVLMACSGSSVWQGVESQIGKGWKEERAGTEYLQLDVPEYADAVNRQALLERYAQVQELLDSPDHENSLTRTTKVMSGVWGNIPAFDRYFCAALNHDLEEDRGYSRLTDRALWNVYRRFSLVHEDEQFLRTARYRALAFSGHRQGYVTPLPSSSICTVLFEASRLLG